MKSRYFFQRFLKKGSFFWPLGRLLVVLGVLWRKKMQNERVKSKTPGLGFGFDVFLIKSSRPKANETEDSMSNLARSRIRT